MKRTFILIPFFIITLSLTMLTSAYAGTSDLYKTVNVIVNGEKISSEGIIKDNRTLVPVRGVFEELGFVVDWEPETKTARFTGRDFLLEIQAGLNGFVCGDKKTGEAKPIIPDVPQQIIDGYFYIPLRAVSESIGADVDWNQEEYVATITKELRERIDFDSFKSEYMKNYFKEKGLEFKEDTYEVDSIQIPSENFTADVLEDLQFFAMLSSVEFTGERVEDFTILKEFFEKHPDSYISFTFPGLKDAADRHNITRFINYFNVRKLIVDKITDKNDSELDKVVAVHDYLVLTTDYDIDNFNSDTIPEEDYDPYYVLTEHKAVCSGYSAAAMGLFELLGIECYSVEGEAYGAGSWGDHEWNIVKVENNYYHLDITFDDPVGVPSDYIDWDHFLKSDSSMRKNHKWEKEDYPVCAYDYGYAAPYDYFEVNKDYHSYNDYDYYDDDYYYEDDTTDSVVTDPENSEDTTDDNIPENEDITDSSDPGTENNDTSDEETTQTPENESDTLDNSTIDPETSEETSSSDISPSETTDNI